MVYKPLVFILKVKITQFFIYRSFIHYADCKFSSISREDWKPFSKVAVVTVSILVC